MSLCVVKGGLLQLDHNVIIGHNFFKLKSIQIFLVPLCSTVCVLSFGILYLLPGPSYVTRHERTKEPVACSDLSRVPFIEEGD